MRSPSQRSRPQHPSSRPTAMPHRLSLASSTRRRRPLTFTKPPHDHDIAIFPTAPALTQRKCRVNSPRLSHHHHHHHPTTRAPTTTTAAVPSLVSSPPPPSRLHHSSYPPDVFISFLPILSPTSFSSAAVYTVV
ncbi:hypothetical protein BDQ17DRAFT_1542718 [Cyathus striatus]|nr:hypothetical protein BDQ17DRAFT_1542718 [Cyathus striatus]